MFMLFQTRTQKLLTFWLYLNLWSLHSLVLYENKFFVPFSTKILCNHIFHLKSLQIKNYVENFTSQVFKSRPPSLIASTMSIEPSLTSLKSLKLSENVKKIVESIKLQRFLLFYHITKHKLFVSISLQINRMILFLVYFKSVS